MKKNNPNKKSNKKEIFKIASYNLLIFFIISLSSLTILEIILKNRNPYSLFPKEMTQKKGINTGGKYFSYFDGAKNVSRYEPKTNVTYKHNSIGFRINKDFDNENFVYDFGNSLISFGDSTSYGVNVENNVTFSNQLAKKITNKNALSFAYPGMNLESLAYKLSCTSKILEQKNEKTKLTLVSLYYNDLDNLNNLEFLNPYACKEVNEINLTNAPIKNKFENINIYKRQYQKDYWIKRLSNVGKYPIYLDLLFCKKLYTRTCPIIKFSIANSHPRIKSIIFGSNEVSGLRSSLSRNNLEKLEKNIFKFKTGLNEISKNSDLVFLFYIPRHELDLINSINGKNRERIFYLYEEICFDQNKKTNLICIDGTETIYESLNTKDLKKLNKNGRLANYYYSYLPTFDMGHPSIFVSNLYSKKLIKEYERYKNSLD